MISGTCEARILVRGKPVTEFFHEGQTFMEGRGGSEFEIEVRNKTANRIMVVVSVDGLSVINGTTAGVDSPGYVIKAFSSIVIPGWKVTDAQAAKFTFGNKKRSYANDTVGQTTNCGVIGVMAFSEKVTVVNPVVNYGVPASSTYSSNASSGIMTKGITRGITASASSPISGSLGSVTATAASATISPQMSVSYNNLGTEFGAATTFSTTATTFVKDTVIDTLVIYYDDARGLKGRGIVLERPIQTRSNAIPDPFPAMNCIPPKGWKA